MDYNSAEYSGRTRVQRFYARPIWILIRSIRNLSRSIRLLLPDRRSSLKSVSNDFAVAVLASFPITVVLLDISESLWWFPLAVGGLYYAIEKALPISAFQFTSFWTLDLSGNRVGQTAANSTATLILISLLSTLIIVIAPYFGIDYQDETVLNQPFSIRDLLLIYGAGIPLILVVPAILIGGLTNSSENNNRVTRSSIQERLQHSRRTGIGDVPIDDESDSAVSSLTDANSINSFVGAVKSRNDFDFMSEIEGVDDYEDSPSGDESDLRQNWQQVDQVYDWITKGTSQQTIMVSGEWGSGKTSLMRIVRRRLLNESQERSAKDIYPTIWFNAWRYQREKSLVVPLLATISNDLDDQGYLFALKAGLGRNLRNTARAFLHATNLKTGVINVSGKTLASEFFSTPLIGGTNDAGRYFGFVSDVEHLVSNIGRRNQDARLVIFIDDLDRCLSDKILEMMEQMKLLFDIPGVIFVMGVAEARLQLAVREYLAEHKDPDPQENAARYTTKLFQHKITTKIPPTDWSRTYASVTGCPLFNDASNELVLSNYARQTVPAFLESLEEPPPQSGKPTPRTIKLWLDGLDAFVHAYVIRVEELLDIEIAEDASILGDLAEVGCRMLSEYVDTSKTVFEIVQTNAIADPTLVTATRDAFVQVIEEFSAPSPTRRERLQSLAAASAVVTGSTASTPPG